MTDGTDKLAVVAIGGNAIIPAPDRLSIQDQYETVHKLADQLADIIEDGWNLLVTHGNGPQVGFILRRSELAIDEVAPVPMDYAGADLQGGIGYMFVRALNNIFRTRNIPRRPVGVITQTLVDRDDPAFAKPVKPIGSWMERARAEELAARYGWVVEEDSDRGWRRVVPSPKPQAIVELESIRDLVHAGNVVVACGGGGIPVIRTPEGNFEGVEAVVDKDPSSAILALELGARMLILPTSVEQVAIDFNTPRQRWLDTLTVSQAKTYLREGQFAEGSMEPKVRALADFVAAGGGTGIITGVWRMHEAVAGTAGTRIVAG